MFAVASSAHLTPVLRNLCSAGQFIRSFSKDNYYEILKLPRTCTQRDIRESFIKLSKQYHPDVSKGMDRDANFIKLSEAYNVLSKSETRRSYDLGMWNPDRSSTTYQYDVVKDMSFYENRDKSKDKYYENKPYYGIKGLKKMSNARIVWMCLCLTAFGVFLQIIAIRNSFTFKREKITARSHEIANEHSMVREEALKNGNQLQLEILQKRLNDR